MEIPKSFESSIEQFYQSVDNEKFQSFEIRNLKKPASRPQTAIPDSAEHAMKSNMLTESIRNDLDGNASSGAFGSFFHDLSGWDMDRSESINDASSLSYLKYHRNQDGTDQGSCIKKKKCQKAIVIRALLSAKSHSSASNIGYRSQNDWGSEEETASRPYALDIHGSRQQLCEEDEDMITDPREDQNSDSGNVSADRNKRDLDRELDDLIEATKGKLKDGIDKPSRSFTRRAVSSSFRPVFHQKAYVSTADVKISRKMAITGQKYHNSDFLQSKDKCADRPLSAIRPSSTYLPRISNQVQETFPEINQNHKKELSIHNERKESVMEIPKWYRDSGTKPSHDQNLIRLMEIMGFKSKLRSPRKLTSTGFCSIPMPNQPPEVRGFVFEKKTRGLNAVLDEIIQEGQQLNLNVVKVPITEQRSFVEVVQSNREAKLSPKIKH